MTRFLQDNSYLQLLNSKPITDNKSVKTFSHPVVDHVSAIASRKHLDTAADSTIEVKRVLPAKKYTIWSFSEPEKEILRGTYCKAFPSICSSLEYIPSAYKKNVNTSLLMDNW